MFPQRQSLRDNSGLEQMLQQLPYAPPVPLPTPIMDRSITSTKWKPNIEVAPNCPRCASTNTKFCYYNNYSLSQPRYFCKCCKRYWTKGGSLRNVPVGGGCRKNRRGKAARDSHQSEHPSMMNNNINWNSGPEDRDSSTCDGDQASSEANGSRDIDMALVFAKFLNQNPSSGEDHGSSSSNNLSTSLTTLESTETEKDAVMQPQNGCDPVIADNDADDMGLLCGVPLEGTIESFGGDGLSLSGIELEGLDVGVMGADEDVVQDVVWCHDDDAIMWQPPPPPMMQMQLQEMECSIAPFNDDGHELLPISSSMNLISDGWSTSWSSFDLSTMEVFSSRP